MMTRTDVRLTEPREPLRLVPPTLVEPMNLSSNTADRIMPQSTKIGAAFIHMAEAVAAERKEWGLDPVACRFMHTEAAVRISVVHRAFSHAFLFLEPEPMGAIILQFHNGQPLAMDYEDRDVLLGEWSRALKHYAPHLVRR